MKRSITTRQEMDQVQAKRNEHDLMLKALKMVDGGMLELYGNAASIKQLGISDQDMVELQPLMLKAIATVLQSRAKSIKVDLENTYGFLLDSPRQGD